MSDGSPSPYLPRGAGGPLRRAAGRVSGRREGVLAASPAAAGDASGASAPGWRPAAVILEYDPLARLLVVPAVAALGLRVIEAPAPGGNGPAPAVVFVPLDGEPDCRHVCTTVRADCGSAPPPVVAGYGAGPPGLLAAHRAHRCADLVLRLTASAGEARFAHLPAVDVVASAGLSEREADVLVLLLHGCTTPAVAERLCVSANTARSHCRAVLRKLGAGDRGALRARLLAGVSGLPSQPLVTPGFEVCPGSVANFAERWAVAPPRHGAHT